MRHAFRPGVVKAAITTATDVPHRGKVLVQTWSNATDLGAVIAMIPTGIIQD